MRLHEQQYRFPRVRIGHDEPLSSEDSIHTDTDPSSSQFSPDSYQTSPTRGIDPPKSMNPSIFHYQPITHSNRKSIGGYHMKALTETNLNTYSFYEEQSQYKLLLKDEKSRNQDQMNSAMQSIDEIDFDQKEEPKVINNGRFQSHANNGLKSITSLNYKFNKEESHAMVKVISKKCSPKQVKQKFTPQ